MNEEIIINIFDDVIQSVNGQTGNVVLNKNDVGLSAVDNTSDLDKPLSNVAANAINTLNTNVDYLSSVVVGSGTIQSLSFNDATSELTISSSNTVAISGYVTSQIDKLGLSNVNALSGDWNSVYNNVNHLSGDWNSVYSNVNFTSANNQSVYNNVKSLSGSWSNDFLPLSGGVLVGNPQIQFNGPLTLFINTEDQGVFSLKDGPNGYSAIEYGNSGLDQSLIFRANDKIILSPNQGLVGGGVFINDTLSASNTIYDHAGNSNNWNSVYNNVNALSAEWEHPLIRIYINGNVDLFNMLNSTEYIIPFNGGDSYDTGYFQYNTANRNIIIKKSGRYRIKVRFAAYDMQDASDYLRIRLRTSFTGLITDVNSGTLFTTLSWRFVGGTLGVNGEMFVEGETYLNNTLPSGTDLYIAATVLGAGGSASGGTTFYPVFDNALGLQPFMEVEKIN